MYDLSNCGPTSIDQNVPEELHPFHPRRQHFIQQICQHQLETHIEPLLLEEKRLNYFGPHPSFVKLSHLKAIQAKNLNSRQIIDFKEILHQKDES